MERRLSRALLIAVLVSQQMVLTVPARAAVDLQVGKPLDADRGDSSVAGAPPPLVQSNLFTGDATMELPVELPPGTGGLTPHLVLAYSSARSRGDGPLGVGWALDIGPAAIQRSTRNGPPSYTPADTYELDGMRLVQTGTANRYVAENSDSSLVDHIVSGGVDYWLLRRPNGSRLYFGYHDNPAANPPNESRNITSDVFAPEASSAVCPNPFVTCLSREMIVASGNVFAWHLDRIEDRNGNMLRFRWESLGDPGARYLKEITYSENVSSSANVVPSFGGSDQSGLSARRTVAFDYGTVVRPDRLPTYRSGFKRQVAHRLSSIVVTANNALVRHLILGYEQSPVSGRSRMSQLTERDAADSQVTQRVYTFSYGNGGTPAPGPTYWSPLNTTYQLPAGLTFLQGGKDAGIRLIDVNSDGYSDVVQANAGTRRTYLGGPNGFDGSATVVWQPPSDFVSGGYVGTVLGDFNADGRPDMLQRALTVSGVNNAGSWCGQSRNSESQGALDHNAWTNTGSGWIIDSTQDRAPANFGTTATNGGTSCPIEYLNLGTTLSGLSARFDQATRVSDINGDGRDDLVYKRALRGTHVEGNDLWQTTELRAGTLLNGSSGLAAGSLNNAHEADAGTITEPFIYHLVYEFRKNYGSARWQPPLNAVQGVYWSNFNSCKASQNSIAEAFTGKEALADLNGDGLPELLESAQYIDPEGIALYFLQGTFVNFGYGWRHDDPTYFPESGLFPRYTFFGVQPGTVVTDFNATAPPSTTCREQNAGQAVDFGVRLVDLNGDGGPEFLVGPPPPGIGFFPARRWDASVSGDGDLGGLSAWVTSPEWTSPTPLWGGNGSDNAARLADVNADGMVDIVVSAGAYVNLSQPPDRLTSVSTPYGAVSTLAYAASTTFEPSPPRENPTVNGQIRSPYPLWVLSSVTTNPGAAYLGQAAPITQDYQYFGPIYDIDDRAFRGFQNVTVLGPTIGGGAGARRPVTKLSYHTRDELRGLPFSVSVWSAPPSSPDGGTLIYDVGYTYAGGSGIGQAQAFLSNGSTAPLSTYDAQTDTQAYSAFRSLMSGSSEASMATLAFRLATDREEVDGTGAPKVSRQSQSYDQYGNVLTRAELGDVAVTTDDVTSVISYAVRNDATVFLVDRPSTITVTGASHPEYPGGTALQRKVEILYDGLSGLGQVNRGNPTRISRLWKGSLSAPSFQAFDQFGNLTVATAPYDSAAPGAVPAVAVAYDSIFQTFPTTITATALANPAASLPVALAYDTGCGPVGMGLVCSLTDPNSNVFTRSYDGFGREIHRTGPNGFEQATSYVDGARATANQRTETRTRWNPAGPSGSGLDTDPLALLEQLFYDGLGRTLRTTRTGPGGTASRAFSYDGTGLLSESRRWTFGDPFQSPPTTFSYDVVGRLVSRMLADGSHTDVVYTPWETTTFQYDGASTLHRKRTESLDGFGRLSMVEEYADPSASLGARTTYLYDPFGSLVLAKDAVANGAPCSPGFTGCATQAHRTEVVYDELGGRVKLVDPDAGTWLEERNPRGQATRVSDPRGFIYTLAYDDLGRLQRRHLEAPISPSVLDVVVEYGLAGTSVPNGRGRIVRIDDQEGYESFEYDGAGNPSRHIRTAGGKGFDFQHTYDPLGRKIQTLFPDGETASWHFDRALLTRISKSGGSAYTGDYVSSISYDALDRATTLGLGGSGPSPVVATSWSFAATSGRLNSIVAVAGGQTVASLGYDISGTGRVNQITANTKRPSPWSDIPDGDRVFSFSYDGLDRLKTASGPFMTDPAQSQSLTYGYDALGNLVEKDNGSPAGWPTLLYNDPVRPHALTQVKDGAGALQREYLYDPAGNVALKRFYSQAGNGIIVLGYDAWGSLTSAGSRVLGYDASGQRLRLSESGSTLLFPEPGYEYLKLASGDRVNKHFFVDGLRVASSSVSWTAPSAAQMRWLGFELPRVPDTPPWAPVVLYGALASLLLGLALRRRQDADFSVAVRVTAAATILGFAPVALGLPPPAATTLGTHGQDALFYVTDHLGSTVITVSSSRTVFTRYLYRPFGDPAVVEGADLHHRFTGEYFDSQFYFLGSRYYDNELGRFLQPDATVPSQANPQALNRYSYVFNNPLNLVDPTGLTPEQTTSSRAVFAESGGGEFPPPTSFPGGPIFFPSGGGSSPGRPPALPPPPIVASQAGNVPVTGSANTVEGMQPGTSQSGQQELPPIAVPNAPPGVRVDANILETRRLSRLDPEAALVDWVNKVREQGQWDYKRLEPVGAYEEFGNFNYGATGRALGFPREVLLRAAGYVQVLESLRTGRPHGPGSPFGDPPYGDFPEDQGPILRGIQYYDRHFWGRRLDIQ